MELTKLLIIAAFLSVISSAVAYSQGDSCCGRITGSILADGKITPGGHKVFTILLQNPDKCTWLFGAVVISSPDSAEFNFSTPFPDHIDGYGTFYVPFDFSPTKPDHYYQLTIKLISPPPCDKDTTTLTFNGSTESASVVEITSRLGFQLGMNYPNPITSSTKFTYTTPAEAQVAINISDIEGKLVKNISSGYVSAGKHDVVTDLSSVPNGSYLLLLESQDIKLMRQIIVAH